MAKTMTRKQILETGISVVYAPEDKPAILDIVIVHGLQGHPFKTWACDMEPTLPVSPVERSSLEGGKNERGYFRRTISRLAKNGSSGSTPKTAEATPVETKTERKEDKRVVYWPMDILPNECPNARILIYGYDTKITKYMAGSTNKNSVYSHSKDLLFALCRERTLDRPLLFVAHSLGGIVVKEALTSSSISTDTELNNVVESTAAVVFLGTPHRGSPDLSALGEWARSILSTLRVETNSSILDILGLKTSDLERAQETFSGLWQKYDFRVKTFQEGLGLTGINLGVLGNKVVPDYSSLIGDPRERAETIQANHMNMCRFHGVEDPNYRKVVGEIRHIYTSIHALNTQNVHQNGRIRRIPSISSLKSSAIRSNKGNEGHSNDLKIMLQALRFPNMFRRQQNLGKPAENTCLWLLKHEKYQDWLLGRNRLKHQGLLWLKGKPGAGKSTLMNKIYRQAKLEQSRLNHHTAAFFFSAKGDDLEHSAIGLFRSLLYQLLSQSQDDSRNQDDFSSLYGLFKALGAEEEIFLWNAAQFESFLSSIFTKPTSRRTFIYIDALDECDSNSIRSQAYFWRQITTSVHAAGGNLNVCLSSRHFPSISLRDCPEIIVENHNQNDITNYVEQRCELGLLTREPQWVVLRDTLLKKSAGIFLWVVLVVDSILEGFDNGESLTSLVARLEIVPGELETLFTQMITSLDSKKKQTTTKLFQWAILTVKPLRLLEWHHILAFIQDTVPTSLNEARRLDYITETDEQLERQIKSISKGLIEVKTTPYSQDIGLEVASVYAGAGSLDIEQGNTRIVEVIHESVREFFLHRGGFSILDPDLSCNPIGLGHFSIITTCLAYLNITELGALIQARVDAGQRHSRPASVRHPNQIHEKYIKHIAQSHTSERNSRTQAPTSPSLRDGRERSAVSQTAKSRKDEKAELKFKEIEKPIDQHHSVLQVLGMRTNTTRNIDIARWIAEGQFVTDQASISNSHHGPIAQNSNSVISQILEDYPALLSYAAYELFHHAWLVEGVNQNYIIESLKENQIWTRLVALNEDLSSNMGFSDFFSECGFSFWAKRESNRKRNVPEDIRPRPTVRPGSVASFASAGSHTGSRRA